MTEQLTLSVVEAGRLIQAGRNLSYKLARAGTLPTIKLGRKLRVPRAALLRMLENAGRSEQEAGQ